MTGSDNLAAAAREEALADADDFATLLDEKLEALQSLAIEILQKGGVLQARHWLEAEEAVRATVSAAWMEEHGGAEAPEEQLAAVLATPAMRAAVLGEVADLVDTEICQTTGPVVARSSVAGALEALGLISGLMIELSDPDDGEPDLPLLLYIAAGIGAASEVVFAGKAGFLGAAATLANRRAASAQGAATTNDIVAVRRVAKVAHVKDLAIERLKSPLPTGQKGWDSSLLADEVFAAWKLEGKAPRSSTIKTYLNELVAANEVILPPGNA